MMMVFHESFFPRIRAQFDRFADPISEFVRSNPIVSSAVVGVTSIGAITGIAAVVRRRRKKKTAKRKAVKRRRAPRKRARVKRRRKHVAHRSPRHRGHKRVMFTTKDGRRVSFLVKPKTSHRIKRRKK